VEGKEGARKKRTEEAQKEIDRFTTREKKTKRRDKELTTVVEVNRPETVLDVEKQRRGNRDREAVKAREMKKPVSR